MIEIKNVTKKYGDFFAVNNVSLTIEQGEFFALLGPSGCGKTTLLRMISGLVYPDKGQILIDGKDVTYEPPYSRKVNMVFQSYAVFPHMSVMDNVAYGLVIDGVPSAEREKRVLAALELVQLVGHEKSYPHQLSGGQKQRVAVARALVKNPSALLLDEPLSALDAKLRESMRSELTKIQKKAGVTFVFVTHDQSEALSLANRIAVMRSGVILQNSSPLDIYENPKTSFVADFIGSTNLLRAERIDAGMVSIEGVLKLDLPLDSAIGKNFYLALRPEKIGLVRNTAPNNTVSVKGKVEEMIYLGEKTNVKLKLASGNVLECCLSEIERKEIGEIRDNDEFICHWESVDMRVLAE